MKKVLIFILAISVLASCTMVSSDPYVRKIEKLRYSKDSFFKFTNSSPFVDSEHRSFMKLDYFKIDSAYRLIATFEPITPPIKAEIESSGRNNNEYYKVGYLHFKLDGKDLTLTAFQDVNWLDDPQLKNNLFVPFADLTSGKTTYGGGRFLDLEKGEGNKIIIDFNLAYNPYCAYNDDWSCPIPPQENAIRVEVKAGEKTYKQTVKIM